MKGEQFGGGSELGDGQVGDHLEVAQVPGADGVPEVESRGADHEVRERDCAAGLAGVGVDLRGKLGHLPGERFHRDRGVDGVQVGAALRRLFRGPGAMQAVLQLDHGYGREHNFGFPVLVFEYRQQFAYRLGVTLGGDQHSGVED